MDPVSKKLAFFWLAIWGRCKVPANESYCIWPAYHEKYIQAQLERRKGRTKR
jgi:hypothetical protein